MQQHQQCQPVIVDGDTCHPIERIEFTERAYAEDWLQKLLFEQPSLIPITEIEPLFSPLIPLARELPTNVGPVDVVYINPSGCVTLVETKLWRNPGARREVVAQIMDYAAAMSKWTFDDLQDAVKRAGGPADLVAVVAESQESFDAARFIDAVSKNLARGRMLLLVAGDGIQEGVEQLTDTLSRSPQLRFSLGLLELGTYRFGSPAKTLVLPRLVARTREVIRAVVEVRVIDGKPAVDVRLPETTTKQGTATPRRRVSEDVLIDEIRASLGSDMGARFEQFLERAEQLGIQPEARDTSVSLRWQEPETERWFTVGSVFNDGHIEFNYVLHYFRKSGLDPQIGHDYVSEVAALVPGAEKSTEKKPSGEYTLVKVAGRPVSVAALLARSDDWLVVIEQFMKRVQKAAEADEGQGARPAT